MPLWMPRSANFKSVHTDLGRNASAYGATITPGNNAYGSYAQVLSAVPHDCYGILINANTISVSAASKVSTVTIGRDLAGGTSFTDWLTDLIIGNAGSYTSGGVWYYFPMFLKAGASLGAKGATINATVGTQRIAVWALGSPRSPEGVRVATKFRQFGSFNIASGVYGTSVGQGTTSEGPWEQVGSAVDTSLWFWQLGFHANDTTAGTNVIHFDVAAGDASNKKILVQDSPLTTTSAEILIRGPMTSGCVANVAAGDNIYLRSWCSGTADSNRMAAVYGCG